MSTRQRKKKSQKVYSVKVPETLAFTLGRWKSEKPLLRHDHEKIQQCDEFYTDERIEEILIPLLTQRYEISLRSIDWLATNYSKKYYIARVSYDESKEDHFKVITINNEYTNTLRKNHSMKFDPFRRRTRIYFQHKDVWYETTVGQLLFLKWAITYGILDYAKEHIDMINEDMVTTHKLKNMEKALAKQQGIKRKRSPLSERPNTPCVVFKLMPNMKPKEQTNTPKDVNSKDGESESSQSELGNIISTSVTSEDVQSINTNPESQV